MNKEIVILTDYKSFFGSKQYNKIYRGGMNIAQLVSFFKVGGFNATVVPISQILDNELLRNNPIIIYTSSEDYRGLYKSYIEDIIFHLEELGHTVLPHFAYLKAHNNKVAMELLRSRSEIISIHTIRSKAFGTIEELISDRGSIKYPVVIKTASGAMSKGVDKAENYAELLKNVKKISLSRFFWHDCKELLRQVKYHKKYLRESFYRNKFVIQNLITKLDNDWKVLVYGNKCYVLFRKNRQNDFRASGSGLFEFRKEIPAGMLDFALNVRKSFNVPDISLDIGFDGTSFHLIEFQFLYYGTTTIEKSNFYFEKKDDTWLIIESKSNLEEVYTQSLIKYIKEKE